MNDFPLVSVVIPMYNAEQYIIETLTSIKSQSYNNYEIIIVDNCSTDSSVMLVEEMKSSFENLKVIRLTTNSGGPARPRNIGIEASKGKYIAFLDSDDVWYPEKLEKQVRVLNTFDWDFVSSRMAPIDDCGKLLRSRYFIIDSIIRAKENDCNTASLMIRNNVITSSTLVRRSAISTIRFNEDDVFKCVEDYLFWLEILSKNTGHYFVIPDVLVGYRIVLTSLSNTDGKFVMLAKSILVNYFAYVKFRAPYHFLRSTVFNLLRILRLNFLK